MHSTDDREAPAEPMLEAAGRAIASMKYGWLATPSGGGLVNARPMGRTPPAPGDDPWLIRFVTDARSRKVAEILPGVAITVICQREADEAYLCLQGDAALHRDASANPALWRRSYEVYLPGEGRAHAAFLEIRVHRMELWMRGVTPEPFGLRPTTFARDAAGSWRLIG